MVACHQITLIFLNKKHVLQSYNTKRLILPHGTKNTIICDNYTYNYKSPMIGQGELTLQLVTVHFTSSWITNTNFTLNILYPI